MSVGFFFFLQQTCRVSEFDVYETVNDDRLVQNGDPYLFGETIYTCVDGRWVKRGMCSQTYKLCCIMYCCVPTINCMTCSRYSNF